MPRPLLLLLTILALSLPGLRSAAAAPEAPARSQQARSAAGARARPAAPRARRAKEPADARRHRGGGAGRAAEPAKTRAPRIPAVSVGHPNDGRLEGGVRLDTSRKEIRVVPAYARADVRWGLPALVGMVERAARGVARRYPGAVLEVGDLSRKGGGDVHRHGSHESGRDVDLGFYALDARGKQVHAPTFLRFNARLASTSRPGVRFDLPRNWLLVQHLLTDPRAHVSHIFIADPLRHALITYAKRIGVSRALIVRAQLAMMQPTGGEPHDDHMHVRISCPRATRGRCIELAKNAPSSRTRAQAARVASAGKVATPRRTPGARARKPAARPAPERPREAGSSRRDPARQEGRRADPPPAARRERGARRAAPREERAGAREALPPAAARAAAQPPRDAVDLSFLRPSTTQEALEADSDGLDAGRALDDSGALKITD
ncbi:penicillin-insensitive murein endopeptidase [Sorangium sp. So ce1036]|uniref:penicillin-insensitive murein endopeptidase n=1 Tax=Sorangium sp. So ce1036 TaxID=3133328 RepID=UPI003F054DD2